MGIPSGSGMFKELFDTMTTEVKRKKKHNYGLAPNMSTEQRKISFLNRYFVYKKTHNVNAENVSRDLLSQTLEDEMAQPPDDVIKEEEFVEEASTTSNADTSNADTGNADTGKKAAPSKSKPKKKITRLKLNTSTSSTKK
jgi:hypothetical protein